MNPTELIALLKAKIQDPDALSAALRLIVDLADGSARLDADTRLALQAELDELTRAVDGEGASE